MDAREHDTTLGSTSDAQQQTRKRAYEAPTIVYSTTLEAVTVDCAFASGECEVCCFASGLQCQPC